MEKKEYLERVLHRERHPQLHRHPLRGLVCRALVTGSPTPLLGEEEEEGQWASRPLHRLTASSWMLLHDLCARGSGDKKRKEEKRRPSRTRSAGPTLTGAIYSEHLRIAEGGRSSQTGLLLRATVVASLLQSKRETRKTIAREAEQVVKEGNGTTHAHSCFLSLLSSHAHAQRSSRNQKTLPAFKE